MSRSVHGVLGLSKMHLSTLVVFTNANGAFSRQAMGPEATELNIGLWHVDMGQEEPKTKDRLGENIENSVSDDLTVNINISRAVSDAPDTTIC